jgi:hypothetical protein
MKILKILFLLDFFAFSVFAAVPEGSMHQGKTVVPKGIIVSDSNTKVYMGRLVATQPPVVRGILVATPYTAVGHVQGQARGSAPTRYYYDSNPVADTLVTIGVIGGLVALFSLGGHHHGHYRYSHHSYHGWAHCW